MNMFKISSPIVNIMAAIVTEMPAAIRPYSMAVAPFVSLAQRLISLYICNILCFPQCFTVAAYAEFYHENN